MKISELIKYFADVREETENPSAFERTGHVIFKKYMDVSGDVLITEMYNNCDEFVVEINKGNSLHSITGNSRHLIKALDLDIVKEVISEDKRKKYVDIISKVLKSTEKTINEERKKAAKMKDVVKKVSKKTPEDLVSDTEEDVLEKSSTHIQSSTNERASKIKCKKLPVVSQGQPEVDKDEIISQLMKKLAVCEETIRTLMVQHKDEQLAFAKAQLAWAQKEIQNMHVLNAHK